MPDKANYEWGEGVYNLLSWFKKDKVKNARVLVAGAGALGNEVVKNLALFGIGHIYVVDFDRIELSTSPVRCYSVKMMPTTMPIKQRWSPGERWRLIRRSR